MPNLPVYRSPDQPHECSRFVRNVLGGAHVHCATLRDVSALDAAGLAAVRLTGRMTVGTQTFSVALDGKAGKPGYTVRPLASSLTTRPFTAPSPLLPGTLVATRLAYRHQQIDATAYRCDSDTACVALCRAFAISADLNVPSFHAFLSRCEGGTKLHYGGQDYYVNVEPGRNGMAGASATLVPIARTAGIGARLLQALRHLFCASTTPVSVRSLERLLTAAIRTYAAKDRTGGVPAAACRARVKAAIRAARVAQRVIPDAAPDLAGARLAGADLTGLDLRGAILRGSDFAGSNLCGARLDGADLHGAILSHARAAGTQWTSADLTNADLTHCAGERQNFRHARLSGARLDGACLDGANFDNAVLHGASCRATHLAGASFPSADLGDADFTAADLAGSAFDQVLIGDGTCIDTMTITRAADISVGVGDVDQALSRLSQAGSPLPRLQRLPFSRRIVSDYLLAVARACEASPTRCAALRDWLEANPDYASGTTGDIVLAPFHRARADGNRHPLNWPMVAPLLPGLMREAIREMDHVGWYWARECGQSIMQLYFLAAEPEAPQAAKDLRRTLKRAYMATMPAAVCRHVATCDQLNGDSGDDDHFPLMEMNDGAGRVSKAGHYALLLTPDIYRHLVRGTPPSGAEPMPGWGQMYQLTAAPNAASRRALQEYQLGGIRDVRERLAPFPLLRAAHAGQARSKWHVDFVKVVPMPAEYRADVESALFDNIPRRRLVDLPHQAALMNAVNQVVSGDDRRPRLTPEHLKVLLATLEQPDATAAMHANFLVCIAVMMMRLSSESWFGTANDSPWALRRYAAALWITARDIHEYCVGPAEAEYTFDDLLSDRCSDGLSRTMYARLRDRASYDPPLAEVLSKVWPQKWRH